MDETRGRLRAISPADTAGHGPHDWVRTWTIAMDALARASVAAAAATAGEQLRAQTADALAGPFADWAFVDLGDGPPWRAVAARRPDPRLAPALTAAGRAECPLITSALQYRAPLLASPVEGESLLGRLPDGRPVIGVLGAHSAVVAPLVSEGCTRGAITIVRCAGSPAPGFVDLGVLSQIADLTCAAATRLSGR
jgi:hypothetical protein